MARLDAKWYDFVKRGFAWTHFWQDGPAGGAVITGPTEPAAPIKLGVYEPFLIYDASAGPSIILDAELTNPLIIRYALFTQQLAGYRVRTLGEGTLGGGTLGADTVSQLVNFQPRQLTGAYTSFISLTITEEVNG